MIGLEPIGAAVEVIFWIVMPIWALLFVAVTIYEARRIYLVVQYKRGNVPIEALPPLREELPDVSMWDLLKHRRS